MYRQGDILIIKINAAPEGAIPVTATPRGYVLAEGEATGHAHVVEAKEDVFVSCLAEALFNRVGVETRVVHEEHNPVVLLPGEYRVVRQYEYTPSAPRMVAD